jgi:hypothetical protein
MTIVCCQTTFYAMNLCLPTARLRHIKSSTKFRQKKKRTNVCLKAPGGTGKILFINPILVKLSRKFKTAAAMAASRTAATLLSGGRTAHSSPKLPLDNVHIDITVCNI